MSIEAFLQGGGSVCPYAAGTRRHYATVGEPLRLYRPVIRGAAEVFARTKGKKPPGALSRHRNAGTGRIRGDAVLGARGVHGDDAVLRIDGRGA